MIFIPTLNASEVIGNDLKSDPSAFLAKSTSSINELFSCFLPTKNSFGANEIWAYYSHGSKFSRHIFFPDVAIFSTKLRLIDIFQRYYYACYSDFSYYNSRSLMHSLLIPFTPNLARIDHPYKLIEKYWDKAALLADLISFKESALLFLPKSTDAVTRDICSEDLKSAIEYCLMFSKAVTICVYYKDIDKYRNLPSVYNVSLVSCGSRFDILFYYRLNLMISTHQFIAFFECGSHNLYASISNKKQLHLNGKVIKKFVEVEQISRYPSDSELTLFNRLSERLRASKEPILAEQYQLFCHFADDNLKRNPYINLTHHIWCVIIRRIIRILIKFKIN